MLIKAILLGLLQGLAEFLPVSSSGHLAILKNIFEVQDELGMFFDVMLHLATLAAVLIAFRSDVAGIWNVFVKLFSRKGRVQMGRDASLRLILLIIIASLPLAAVVFFEESIEKLADNLVFVGAMLIATGTLLFISSKCEGGKKNEKNARVTDAFIVGAMQAVATVPGLSRSGMTITGGLMRGFDRAFAVRFSFLMSVPAVLGAVLLKTVKALREGIDPSIIGPLLAGMAVAGVSGFFAIILINKLVIKNRFSVFAWYCLAAGTVTVLTAMLKG